MTHAAKTTPPDRLLTTPTERASWKAWFTKARAASGAPAVFQSHPRARELSSGFAVGSYLSANANVAEGVQDPAEAVFHYLEFGASQGPRSGRATHWDAGFTARVHGHSLPPDLTPEQAATRLIALGVPVEQLSLCERDLWLLHGLYGQGLTKLFHHETYFAATCDMASPPTPDRLSCIRHFIHHGLDAGLPAHPDHVLDPEFYCATLKERSIAFPENLHHHWARFGLRIGAQANAHACARAMGLRIPRTGIPHLPITSEGRLERIIDAPLEATARLDAREPGLRTFLNDLGRLQKREGNTVVAEALFMRVLDAKSDDARAAVDLANIISGRSENMRDIGLRSVAPLEFDLGNNRIAMAEAAFNLEDFDQALSLAASVPETSQADIHLRRRIRALGRAVFEAIWADLPDTLTRYKVTTVQSLLTRAADIYAPRPDTLRRTRSITRVAILANDDIYQCKLYRADQKADQLRAQGLHVRLYLQSRDVARLTDSLDQYDAVIFQRSPAFPAITDLMIAANRLGLATFYDIDDQVFDTALFPPPLAAYAGQIEAERHAVMSCGVPLFAAAARLCDVGIASTEPLRAALAGLTLSGTAFTHANALGAAHLSALEAPMPARSEKLVLFYGSGTRAHKAEFRDILEPALARILTLRPGAVEVRLMGQFPDLIHLDPTHPDVTLIPPVWDFETYMEEVSKADIALSVLAPSPVTDAKSELKWMEPALFAIPAVVSPTAVMSSVIEDGVTGMLAADTDAFVAKITQLIDDPDLRRSIGTAAQAHVMEAYALPKMGASLVENMNAVLAPERTRVMVVNVFYPPQAIGGATRVVADNVKHLRDHYGDDYDIDVVTTLNGGLTPQKLQLVSHSNTRIWSIVPDNSVPSYDLSNPRMDVRMEEVFDRINPQIVHIHCIQSMGVGIIDLCRRRGVPYVITLHDGFWASPHQFILGPDGTAELYDFASPETLSHRARVAKRCIDHASAVLAVSEPFAALHRAIGLPNVTALPNGVSNLPKRQHTPAPDGRVRLALIGGASRHKGYDILRAAILAHGFKNLDLLIVDHALLPGMETNELWNTTPVRRIPRQPQSLVGALYGSFDVLLAPSVWPESYGLVAREALALGLWVVASDRGAIGADITEGENGHIIPVDDHRALVSVLDRIDADPARYATQPALNPDLHPASAQGDALAALYQQILSAPSG